ncbi:hypothetical protein [Lysobacter auxotrophicus]|uniref:Secreted protein n=1 Tax=Lysobacter auxotrophicus TaxID=2992573 RepID=A0ABN6UJ24_9GAMM|nr:hypothetical protein [Lysobacter auxotrophicus]BDU16236.1 hypothetical protein LA521A_14370 [Lysobacter auxotrophicus]
MNRKRSSTIAACGFVLAGVVLPASGASRTAALSVTADVVAACEVRVVDDLLPDTRDARSGASHLLALVSF